ncbi:MAG: hypothetical protein ABF624_00135 [Liquorilactobacillus ghanensis]|uniref:hypothetical protein n=1 Tax=Liquorilactobacillus ghanensis TaxID=399370 RepID=UPI0039EA855E
MKFILCQPAILRFKWELEVCLTNLVKTHGVNPKSIILLFSQSNASIPDFFKEKYGIEIHVYRDERDDKNYIPSIKPYLWFKFLEEDSSRQNETYFYMDSDVVFRKLPDFSGSKPDKWLCSDCNSYLNLDYIRNCKNGEEIIKKMCDIVGVTKESIETININSGGAQWIINSPKKEYWLKVYNDCNKLYKYFKSADTDLQIWTAEMWAQLWNMMYFNIGPKVDKKLDFVFATDPIEQYEKVNILHNAGVTENMKNLFFKGKYVRKQPFGEDFSFVDKSKASFKYVEAIQKVEC